MLTDSTGGNIHVWEVLFPKWTDVRDNKCSAVGDVGDVAEITPGSGRLYNIIWVDDKAAGFTNEYRLAMVQKRGSFHFPPWPPVDPAYAPPGGGPWIPPYTGP